MEYKSLSTNHCGIYSLQTIIAPKDSFKTYQTVTHIEFLVCVILNRNRQYKSDCLSKQFIATSVSKKSELSLIHVCTFPNNP